MNLGETIKKERVSLGISQKDMADKIGVSAIHYCGIENGKRGTTIQVLEKVAEKLQKKLVVTFIDKE